MKRLATVIAMFSIVATLAGCAARFTAESPAASPDFRENDPVFRDPVFRVPQQAP